MNLSYMLKISFVAFMLLITQNTQDPAVQGYPCHEGGPVSCRSNHYMKAELVLQPSKINHRA